jgi:hypothetical protein
MKKTNKEFTLISKRDLGHIAILSSVLIMILRYIGPDLNTTQLGIFTLFQILLAFWGSVLLFKAREEDKQYTHTPQDK